MKSVRACATECSRRSAAAITKNMATHVKRTLPVPAFETKGPVASLYAIGSPVPQRYRDSRLAHASLLFFFWANSTLLARINRSAWAWTLLLCAAQAKQPHHDPSRSTFTV